MKKHLVVLAALFLSMSVSAQTIVELNRGGQVRAKTADDYNREHEHIKKRNEADSVAYNNCIVRGLNALHSDSLMLAKQLFNEAIALRPEAPGNFVVRHLLGRIEMAQTNYPAATKQFTKLLKMQPMHREVRLDRATCYFEQNNWKATTDDCQVIVDGEQRDDIYLRTLFLRSAAYRRTQRPDLAKTDLEEILRLQPQNTSALLLLPLCLEQMNRRQEAMEQLNLFVAAHPDVVEGWTARAEMEVRREMFEAARADYDKAIALSPHDASLRIARAKVLLQVGAKASARKDLDEAVRLGARKSELASLYQML